MYGGHCHTGGHCRTCANEAHPQSPAGLSKSCMCMVCVALLQVPVAELDGLGVELEKLSELESIKEEWQLQAEAQDEVGLQSCHNVVEGGSSVLVVSASYSFCLACAWCAPVSA